MVIVMNPIDLILSGALFICQSRKEMDSDRWFGTSSDARSSTRPDDILFIEEPTLRERVNAWMEGRSPYLFPLYDRRPDPYQWFDPEQGRQ